MEERNVVEVGWDYSDGSLRLVMLITGGDYVEWHWRLGKLGNKSRVCG